MLSAAPQPTPYDWRFGVLGFPVRVHPFFWLMSLLVGFGLSRGDGLGLILVMGTIFLSVLVHELGHALLFRRFGNDCHIVLHGFGGLAIPGREEGPSSWGFSSKWSQVRQPTLHEQIAISFAGPAAGFILAGVTILLLQVSGGEIKFVSGQFGIPQPVPRLGEPPNNFLYVEILVNAILWVNISWGLLNLLPVYPLDGGQIAMAAMTLRDPWRGTEQALWVSMVTGGVVAVVGAVVLKELWLTAMFGSMAYSSYAALQQLGGGGRPW